VENKTETTLSDAPCDKCGYNGEGYYQPDKHPCAGSQTTPREALFAAIMRTSTLGRDDRDKAGYDVKAEVVKV
jgi:hypothetical protein